MNKVTLTKEFTIFSSLIESDPDKKVISDPRKAEISRTIQMLKAEVEEIKRGIKAIYKEGHSRGVSALDREKKNLETRISLLEAEKEQLPKDQVSAKFLLKEIVRGLEQLVEQAEIERINFRLRLGNDLMTELIGRYASDIAKAEEKSRWALDLLNEWAQSDRTLESMITAYKHQGNRANKKVIRNLGSGFSSDPVRSGLHLAGIQGLAEVADGDSFFGWGYHSATYYLEENSVFFDDREIPEVTDRLSDYEILLGNWNR